MEVKSDKVWSTQDLVDNASNWTLAGDAALLKHLESFSENLFAKANETNDRLNGLLDNLNAASIKLDLVKNEFLSLQNTQFIESRVYEDDETVESVQETVETKKNDEEARKNALKSAVLAGLEIMHNSYDKVRVPASDSEDEDGDGGSFVLSMKDPYMSRPLPYVIGTEDWYKDTHVGLEESESDSEPECEKREVYSDSDSESNLPVTDRRGVSTSDSGTDISNRIERPVANSTFNDTMASTDSEEYNNSVPNKAPISNVSFAEQLAAKLGNVAVESKEAEPEPEPEINRRPLQKAPPMPARVLADLDEPPPLDDFDDGLLADKGKQGMFSGGDGLFDESGDESNSFWGTKRVEEKKNPVPSKSAEQTEKEEKSETRGLFDDEESDEDIFATSVATQPPQRSILKPFSSSTIYFVDDEPPEIPDESKDKSQSTAFKPDKLLINAEQRPPKKISLFDDADFKSDPFSEGGVFGSGNGLFAGIGKKNTGGGLFDDEDNLFASVKRSEKNESKKRSLFMDEEGDSKKKSLFLDEEGDSKKKSLFLDEEDDSKKSLFLDDEDERRFKKKPYFTKEEEEDKHILEKGLKKKSYFTDEEEEDKDRFKKKPYFTKEEEEKDTLEKGLKKKPGFTEDNEEEERESVKTPFEDEDDIIEEGFVKKSLLSRGNEAINKELKKTLLSRENEEQRRNDGKDVVDKSKDSRLFNEDEDLFSLGKSKESEVKKTAGLFEDNEDIFGEESDFLKKASIFSSATNSSFFDDDGLDEKPPSFTEGPTKTVPHFVNSTPPPDDDWETKSDHLFEDSDDVFEEPPVLSTQRSNPFDEEPPTLEPEVPKQKSLFEDDVKSEVKDVKKPAIKSKPTLKKPKPKEEINSKPDDGFEDNKQNVREESPKKALPGKLKHNLNINVSALMPGAALPRRRDPVSPLNKSQSLEEAGGRGENPEDGDEEVAHAQSYRDVRAPDEGRGLDDDDDGRIKPLHSYTKNRAKVPMKRKPSTRRGRQESMRKHVVESSNELSAADTTANNNYLQSGGDERGPLNNNLTSSSASKTDDVCNLQFAKSNAEDIFGGNSGGALENDMFVTSKSKSDSSRVTSKRATVKNIRDNRDGRLFKDDPLESDFFNAINRPESDSSATVRGSAVATKGPDEFVDDPLESDIFAGITSKSKKDSSIFKSDTSIFKSDSSTFKSDSSTFKSDSSTFKSDSSTFKSDSSTFKSDSSIFKSDSSIIKSDSSTVKSDSSTVRAASDSLTDTNISCRDAGDENSSNATNITSKDYDLDGDSNESSTNKVDNSNVTSKDALNITSKPESLSKIESDTSKAALSNITFKVGADALDVNVLDVTSNVLNVTSNVESDISSVKQTQKTDFEGLFEDAGNLQGAGAISKADGNSSATNRLFEDELFARNDERRSSVTSKGPTSRDVEKSTGAISKESPVTRQLFGDDILFNNELSETSKDLFGESDDFLFNKGGFNNKKSQEASTKASNKNVPSSVSDKNAAVSNKNAAVSNKNAAASKKNVIPASNVVGNVSSNSTGNIVGNVSSSSTGNISSTSTGNVSSNSTSNVSSSSTDNVSSNSTINVSGNPTGNVANKSKGKESRSSSLFEDDEDTFDIFARRSGKPAKAKDVVLFEDNDDDLFAARPAESKPKKSLFAEEKPQFKPVKKLVGKKGSLFDDVSEDDDIFSSGTRTVTKVNVLDKKSKAKSLVRKAEEREVTYDPLDALSGNPNHPNLT